MDHYINWDPEDRTTGVQQNSVGLLGQSSYHGTAQHPTTSVQQLEGIGQLQVTSHTGQHGPASGLDGQPRQQGFGRFQVTGHTGQRLEGPIPIGQIPYSSDDHTSHRPSRGRTRGSNAPSKSPLFAWTPLPWPPGKGHHSSAGLQSGHGVG